MIFVRPFKKLATIGASITLLGSCSTYVPIKDYQIPEYRIGKDKLIVLHNNDGTFGPTQLENLQKEFRFHLEKENPLNLATLPVSFLKDERAFNKYLPKDKLDLYLSQGSAECEVSDSYDEGEKSREAMASCYGRQKIVLSDHKDKKLSGKQWFESKSSYENKVSLPDKPGSRSLRPIFSALLNIKTERERAIESQDQMVTFEAKSVLGHKINKQIVSAVVPITKKVRLKYDDDLDHERVEDLVDEGDFRAAISILESLPESIERTYNLCVLHESLGEYEKAKGYISELEKNSRKELHMEQVEGFKSRYKKFITLQKSF